MAKGKGRSPRRKRCIELHADCVCIIMVVMFGERGEKK